MTNRLYYDHNELISFSAHVLSCEPLQQGYDLVLDMTAFYPTSGGQPFDTGTLGEARVLDVTVDAGHVVHHTVDRPLAVGREVTGCIDWARRFDHMQQHSADHMVAGKIWNLYQGYTIGLHLGAEFSTIDIVMPGGEMHLTPEQTCEVETLVNQDIQANVPVKCFFPSEVEMAGLPLRKQPTVDENIRVVLIGEDECVACGGTHVSAAGQIGLVKILWTAPSRGKLRLAFVAGMRAFRDYQVHSISSDAASALLSCKVEQLPASVEAMQQRIHSLETELSKMKRAQTREVAQLLAENALPLLSGWGVVTCELQDGDMNTLKELAKYLIEHEKICVLLGLIEGERTSLLFARSPGSDGPDMGALLREVAKTHSGKGGGHPDFAQGAVHKQGAIQCAQEMLTFMS